MAVFSWVIGRIRLQKEFFADVGKKEVEGSGLYDEATL